MGHLALLGASILLCSISFGSVYAAYNPIEVSASEAASYKKGGNMIEFGSCPQTYQAGLTQDLNNGNFYNKDGWQVSESSRYAKDPDGNRYRVVDECHANYNGGDAYLREDHSLTISMLEGQPAVFKYEPIKWRIIEEDEEYYKVIPYSVYYTTYYSNDGNALFDLSNGNLRQRLLIPFFSVSDSTCYFTGAEVTLIKRDKQEAIEVAFAEGGTGHVSYYGFHDDGKTLHEERPSDYMIMTGLDVTQQGVHYPPVWIKDVNSDRVGIVISGKWYLNETSVNENLNNSSIGVMPIISLKKLASGGASSKRNPTSSTPSNVNGTLIVSVITGVIGTGGLIATLICLYKRLKENPDFKPKKWYYAIIFASAALAMVFCVSLPSATSGGLSTCALKMGIYVQDDDLAKDTIGGIGVIQAGYIGFVIYEDGTGGYCMSMNDNKNASDFKVHVDQCSWSLSGSNFVFKKDGSYAFQIKGKYSCDYIKTNEGSFRWVREA